MQILRLAPLTVQNIIRLFTRIYRHRHAAPLLLHIILYAYGAMHEKSDDMFVFKGYKD